MVQARDSALLPIDSRLPVSLSTLRFAVSLMQRVSRQPEGPQSSRREKRHENNRVVTRILMIAVLEKKNSLEEHVLVFQSPRWPSIPRGQFRRCQSRFPLDVLALRPASMLELTLYLSLVVRPWCRAFLFPDEQGLAFASGISPEFALVPLSGNVPHLQKPAHIRCRDELFAELVRPFHLDFRQPCPSRILRH